MLPSQWAISYYPLGDKGNTFVTGRPVIVFGISWGRITLYSWTDTLWDKVPWWASRKVPSPLAGVLAQPGRWASITVTWTVVPPSLPRRPIPTWPREAPHGRDLTSSLLYVHLVRLCKLWHVGVSLSHICRWLYQSVISFQNKFEQKKTLPTVCKPTDQLVFRFVYLHGHWVFC